MAAYFFSDVHLGLESPEREKEKENHLLSFLKAILPTTDQLFVVGDLFDFWFEYGTVIPKGYHRTLTALQEFTDRGATVHYIAGNHDFWIGDFFARELGMQLHFDPLEVTVDGKRVFLHHGDGLAENDLGYRMIKPVLRNRFNIALYRWLHPDLGVRLARRSSRSSRAYSTNKHYGEAEGMLQFARDKARAGIDFVVMGHRHKPSVVTLENAQYINLGDWITYHTYAELAGGTMQLKMWDGKEGKIYAA
jgi:UDP-2,3-diacylglucosamine hydrolase